MLSDTYLFTFLLSFSACQIPSTIESFSSVNFEKDYYRSHFSLGCMLALQYVYEPTLFLRPTAGL